MRRLLIVASAWIVASTVHAQPTDAPRMLKVHRGSVNSINYTPSGERFLSGSADETAIIWNATWSTPVAIVEPAGGAVLDAQFNVGETRMTTVFGDSTHVLDGASFARLLTIGEQIGIGSRARHSRWQNNRIAVIAGGSRVVAIDVGGSPQPWSLQVDGIDRFNGASEVAIDRKNAIAFYPAVCGQLEPYGGCDFVYVAQFALKAGSSFRPSQLRYDRIVGRPFIAQEDGRFEPRFSIDVDPTGEWVVLSGMNNRGVIGFRSSFSGDTFELGHRHARQVRWGTTGRWILTGGDTTVMLWDAGTHQLVRRYELPAQVRSVAWAPGDSAFAIGLDNGWIALYGAAPAITRYFVPELPVHLPRTLVGEWRDTSIVVVRSLATSAPLDFDAHLLSGRDILIDGTTTVNAGAGKSASIRLRFSPLSHGRIRDTLILTGGVAPLRIPLEGEAVRIRFVDPEDSAIVLSGRHPAFSPDGSRLAYTSYEGHDWPAVEIVDVATGAILSRLGRQRFVAFDRTGERLMTTYDDTTRIWRTSDVSLLNNLVHSDPRIDPQLHGVGTDSTFTYLGVGGTGLITVWSILEGRQLWSSLQHGRHPQGAIIFDPTGQFLAETSIDSNIAILEARSGTIVRRLHHPGRPGYVAYRHDGRKISSSVDTNVYVWDVATGTVERRMSVGERGPARLRYSRSGTLIGAITTDSLLRVWRAADGTVVLSLRGPWPYSSFDISPDDSRIAVGHSTFEERFTIYDVTSSRMIREVNTGGRWNMFPLFRSDGALLAVSDETSSAIFGPSIALPYVRTVPDSIDLRAHGTIGDSMFTVTVTNDGPLTIPLRATISPSGSPFAVVGNGELSLGPSSTATINIMLDAGRIKPKDRAELHADTTIAATLNFMLGKAGSVADVRLVATIVAPISSILGDLENVIRIRTYPNPADDRLVVEFDLQEDAPAIIRVVDVLGRTVRAQPAGTVSTGRNIATIDVAGLIAGSYRIVVSQAHRFEVVHIVVR